MGAAIPPGLHIVGGILLVGLASRYGKKKVQTTDDSKPATLTDRGVRVLVVLGRTRGGPIHAFEGDRVQRLEPFSGGAGGKGVGSNGGSQNDVYFASGWHIVAVGPAYNLREIYENGEPILNKPTTNGFDPISLPSGSQIPLYNTEEGRSRGRAYIFWGQADQPISPFLSNPTRLGYTSNHKFIFHIVWEEKRLGGAGTWPALEYEYEVRPYQAGQLVGVDYDALVLSLGSSLGSLAAAGNPWLQNSLGVPTGATCQNLLLTDDGPPGSLKIMGNQTASFPVNGYLKIQNNGSGVDGNYQISARSYNALEEIEPLGTFTVNRVTRNNPSLPTATNGWIHRDILTLSDTSTTSGGPPGVIVQPFTANGGNPQAASFSFIPASLAAGSCVRATPLASNPDPDAGSAGTNQQFNGGVNRHTFYVRSNLNSFGTATHMVVSFVSENSISPTPAVGRQHGVRFRLYSSAIFNIVPFGGASVEVTDLGPTTGMQRWYRITILFRVGSGGITVATDPCYIQYELEDASPTGNFVLVHGEGQAGTVPKWQYSNLPPIVGITTINTFEQLFGIGNFTGQVCPLSVNENGYQGANGAHLLYQLMFETEPHGLGLEAACYNIESLQALGLLLDAPQEGIRSHITVPDSTTLDAAIQALLEELQVNLAWDSTTGKWTFVPVRRKIVADGIVEREILTEELPSRRRRFGEELRTKLVYLYPNCDLRYRQDAIVISEDGRASLELREDAQKVTLYTVRDPEAAVQIGEKKSLWEFSKPTAYSVLLNRDAAVLRPGDLLDFGELLGIDVPVRVMTVQPSTKNSVVKVIVTTDPYAEDNISSSSFVVGATSSPQESTASIVQEDAIQRLWELPAFLGREIQFIPLRTPATFPTAKAALYTSADGVNYTVEAQVPYVCGGTLVLDFLEDLILPVSPTNYAISQYQIEEGPVIMSSNPSFADGVLSLSESEWASGRQMLVIDDEIMYVREFLPYGGNLWQAIGVLRARLGTTLQDHLFDADAFVVIGGSDNLPKTKILAAGRGLDTHWKLVPNGIAPGVVSATIQEVFGIGIKPMSVTGLTTQSFSNGWVVGEDLVLRWDYKLPQGSIQRSGSGMQGYGEVTGSGSPGDSWPGVFRAAIFNAAGTVLVLGSVDLTTARWEIPSATLSAALVTAGLASDADLAAAVIPIYATGETGERTQIVLPNVA